MREIIFPSTFVLVLLLAAPLTAISLQAATAQTTSTPATETSVMIRETRISWEGDWQYRSENSTESLATLVLVDQQTGRFALATYGEFEYGQGTSREEVLEGMADSLEESGVGASTRVDDGELDDGSIWGLYAFSLESISLSMLITVGSASDGAYIVSTTASTRRDFEGAIAQAQEEIYLNGQPVFLDGIDAEEIARTLATPDSTPAE